MNSQGQKNDLDRNNPICASIAPIWINCGHLPNDHKSPFDLCFSEKKTTPTSRKATINI